jgi:hypothetical protein
VAYKAGTITTDGSGVGTVTFNTAFGSTNYGIVLGTENTNDTTFANWNTKASGGFGIITTDDKGVAEASCVVNWAIFPYEDA